MYKRNKNTSNAKSKFYREMKIVYFYWKPDSFIGKKRILTNKALNGTDALTVLVVCTNTPVSYTLLRMYTHDSKSIYIYCNLT